MVDIGKILGKREEKYCLFFCFGMDSRFARRSNLNLFSISSRYLFRTRQTFQGIMTKYNHHLSRRRLKRCVFSIYSYDKKQWNIYIYVENLLYLANGYELFPLFLGSLHMPTPPGLGPRFCRNHYLRSIYADRVSISTNEHEE